MGKIIQETKIVRASMEPIYAHRLRFGPVMIPSRFLKPGWFGRDKKPVYWSKSNAFETGLILLIFNNTNFATVGDATGLRGSSTAGSFYLSLHTADPGEAGTQTTSEIAYTSYARVAVARASGAGGFTCSADTATLTDATTSFPAGTGGSGTATYFGIGTASSGTGVLLYSGTVSPSVVTGSGITPQLTSASSVVES